MGTLRCCSMRCGRMWIPVPSRKIDDLQVTITSAGVELAQDGVGVVQVDADSIMRLIDALQGAWYRHAGVPPMTDRFRNIGDGLYATRDGGTVRFYDEGDFLFRVQRFQFPAMMSLFAPEDPSAAQEVAVDA